MERIEYVSVVVVEGFKGFNVVGFTDKSAHEILIAAECDTEEEATKIADEFTTMIERFRNR